MRSKRAEFWDTAPAFEGRREIWDALRAAAVAAEGGDYALAQAIVDGASISLPGGTLLECYDELGKRLKNEKKRTITRNLHTCKTRKHILAHDEFCVCTISIEIYDLTNG